MEGRAEKKLETGKGLLFCLIVCCGTLCRKLRAAVQKRGDAISIKKRKKKRRAAEEVVVDRLFLFFGAECVCLTPHNEGMNGRNRKGRLPFLLLAFLWYWSITARVTHIHADSSPLLLGRPLTDCHQRQTHFMIHQLSLFDLKEMS